jgi:formate-dependent nitrite reductase membrane component NrfD
MTEVDLFRQSNLIDPALAIWGWEIPVYLFLGGLSAGVMILSAWLARTAPERARALRLAPLAVPVLLSAGMLALFLDLGFKAHVYRFYLAFEPSSPMSWGAWILILVYPAAPALAVAGLTDGEASALAGWRPLAALRLARPVARLVAWCRARASSLAALNVGLGAALGVYTGILLGALGARAAWSSSLLGPLFLVSGVSTAAAGLMLLPSDPGAHARLRRWDVTAVGLELALLALYLLGLATGDEAARQAAHLFLGGGYTAAFWTLVVILGLLVPLGLEALEARRGLRPTAAAPALLLAGGFALRWILVAAGQAL